MNYKHIGQDYLLPIKYNEYIYYYVDSNKINKDDPYVCWLMVFDSMDTTHQSTLTLNTPHYSDRAI